MSSADEQAEASTASSKCTCVRHRGCFAAPVLEPPRETRDRDNKPQDIPKLSSAQTGPQYWAGPLYLISEISILSSCEAFVKSKRNSKRHSQPEKAGWKMGLFKLMWATTAPTCYCVHQGENLISSQNAVYQCCALLNIYFLPPHPCPEKTARSRG